MRPAALTVKLLIFHFRCYAAAYVTLRLVVVEHYLYFFLQLRVYLFKPLRHVFVYRAFAYAKFFCRASDRSLILYYVFAEYYGAFLNYAFHSPTLQTIPIANSYAEDGKNSTWLLYA